MCANCYLYFFLLLIVQNDTFRVHWAYSDQDPNKEPADLSQLPPLSRSGSRSLHLYESTHTFNQKTADSLQWMVQSNSVKLPARHTLYWCTMLKLPEMPGKHHMIGYKPVISEASQRYVHHMMLYECHDEVYIMFYSHVSIRQEVYRAVTHVVMKHVYRMSHNTWDPL
jgi:hypothetical protein